MNWATILAIWLFGTVIMGIINGRSCKRGDISFSTLLRRAVFWFIYAPAFIIDFKMEY